MEVNNFDGYFPCFYHENNTSGVLESFENIMFNVSLERSPLFHNLPFIVYIRMAVMTFFLCCSI